MNRIFILLFCIVFISCVSSNKPKSTIETVSPGNYSFENALGAGVVKIHNDLPEGSKIAILAFKSDNENLSSYIVEEMYDKLINLGMTVLERNFTDAIAMEVGYQLSGEVDDREIIRIGNQLGANYVVTGQIIFSGEAYRLRIFAIDIEKAQRVASSSLNISSNDKQINYLITLKRTENIMSDKKVIVLNDTLIIKQNDTIIENQAGRNWYNIKKNVPFDILVHNEDEKWIYYNARIESTHQRYKLPINASEIFFEIGAPSNDPIENYMLVFSSDKRSSLIIPSATLIDVSTGMTRVHFKNFKFYDSEPRNFIRIIIYIDYNSNYLIEENEIMYLTFQLID